MSHWHVSSVADPAAAERFADLDAVFTLEGEIVAMDSLSRTLRVVIGGRRYYVKRYHGLGKKPLRRLLGTPRVQLEWENLQRFAAWDIPTARLVAYGFERQGGLFARGAMITEEIPNASDLARLARSHDPRLESRSWRHGVIGQVADIARRMHARRFAHGDLKWRNLLVDEAGKVFLIDCPSGGFWYPPFLEYRIVKDLACLDKLAKRHLSRSDRLRFYLAYAQKRRLDEADKRRIGRIVGFFEGRDDRPETATTLRAVGRRLVAPCAIALEGGGELRMVRWLRILPGKRLTGIGQWQGQTVLAKLFIAARGAARHWQRECRGIARLEQHGLPTPKLLATGRLEGTGYFVLTEYLEGAQAPCLPPAVSGKEAGQAAETRSAVAQGLTLVFQTLGRMHERGILQKDVHLGNFLLHGERLYVIDGDAIRPAGSARQRLDNLALLFAQLPPPALSPMQTGLLSAYRAGNPHQAIDATQLDEAIARARQARLTDYLDKCLRDCSLFKVMRRVDRFIAQERAEADFLAPLIADPDAWLEQGIPLKRGRSATLALVELEGRKLVIKRYNIKDAGHALSRAWRPSRAWHAWIEAHRLRFLGIDTPRPLALIERRLGPLRGRAWLVTEYCAGPTLQERLAGLERLPQGVGEAARRLFAQLAAARLSHGDLKATNFVLGENGLCLLDLDAMRSHASEAAWRQAWRQDRARFLRNWPAGSTLRRELDAALPPA